MRLTFHISSILFVIAFSLLLPSCYEEQIKPSDISQSDLGIEIKLNDNYGIIDNTTKQIFFTIGADSLNSFNPKVYISDNQTYTFEGQELINKQVNQLGKIIANKNYELLITENNTTTTYNIIFTTFPIIHISTNDEIVDEPKVLSKIYLQYNIVDSDPNIIFNFETYAGIEIRGNYSSRYDKKSFGIEFWLNENRKDYPIALMNMRPSADWILDAMYDDKLRMRNKISNLIWKEMSSIPEVDASHRAFPGIESHFVEVFINNAYHGLYNLNEKINEVSLDFYEDQNQIGGVIYKGIGWTSGSASFDSLNSLPPDEFIWEGFEQKYPKTDTAWHRLYQLREFIINSDNAKFDNELKSMLDYKNLCDYYLFVNLISAYDNMGKNTFLASYSNESPFFIMPWDTEWSWGIAWPGNRTHYSGTTTNGLFRKLVENNTCNFNQALQLRWAELRKTTFSDEYLQSIIDENYFAMKNNGAYEREKNKWQDEALLLTEEYEYIKEWIQNRILFLDDRFEYIPE